MKKILSLILLGFMISGLTACISDEDVNTSDQAIHTEVSQTVENVSDEQTEEIQKLEDKIKDLEEKLEAAYSSISAKEDEILSLENRIAVLENPDSDSVITKAITVGYDYENHGMICAYVIENYDENNQYGVVVRYGDGTEKEVLKGNFEHLYVVAANDDGTKIIMNNHGFENISTVWMYDVESRETEILNITLPEQRTVSGMSWLDSRYFMYTLQLDAGTVVRGGDVWLYDTQTGEHKAIIQNSDWSFQTVSCQTHTKTEYDADQSYVVVYSMQYDENMTVTSDKYHILTVEEILRLYSNNETVDLSQIQALN